MRPLPVDPFAGMPGFVLGLSMIRGESTPVVDCGALLGDARRSEHTRFITLRTGERTTALAVEAVLGIADLPPGLHDLPPLLGEASHELVSAVGALDAELLLVLSSTRLIPDSLWRNLDAASRA